MDYARHVVKSVIARLKAYQAFNTAIDGRIYTDVPEGQVFPYAVVSITSDPFATQDVSGQQHTLRVQVFSRQDSINEALTLRAMVNDALDRQEALLPTLDVGQLVKCEATGTADAFKEDDGRTWQALCEFDIITM
jgi:hypothetical protein